MKKVHVNVGTIGHNRAELEMLGYCREEYIGRHIADFHADEGTICDILFGSVEPVKKNVTFQHFHGKYVS